MHPLLLPTKRNLYWMNGAGIATNLFLLWLNVNHGGWFWIFVPFQIAAVCFCTYAIRHVYKAPDSAYPTKKEEIDG